MNYYISVLVPTASGRWHAFFPDFPACEAEASDLDLTAMHAARALVHYAGRFTRRDLGRASATRPTRRPIG